MLFTWAWYLVNRGSKYWQENWENHVDMLEDAVIGPLYKTVLERPSEADFFERYFTGPLAMSVSKINQWVSCFTLCIWGMLIYHSLPPLDVRASVSVRHALVGIITIAFSLLMIFRGKTHKGSFEHVMMRRDTQIL